MEDNGMSCIPAGPQKGGWYERFGNMGMDCTDLCTLYGALGIGLCRDHCWRILSSLMAEA